MDDAESIFSNPVFQIAGMFRAANSDDTPEIPEGLSEEGKEFLRQCLRRDPRSRRTAAQLMGHPFVREYFSAAWASKIQPIGRQGYYLALVKSKSVDELHYIPLSGGIVSHRNVVQCHVPRSGNVVPMPGTRVHFCSNSIKITLKQRTTFLDPGTFCDWVSYTIKNLLWAANGMHFGITWPKFCQYG